MGISDDQIDRYANESGYSPTILRRRLAIMPALKSPPWAHITSVARKLVPLVFAGAWDSSLNDDQCILSTLATSSTYEEVEQHVSELQRMEDTPVWAIGKYRGISSKIDALYAIHSQITEQDLERFFTVAKIVLSECDPSLDLPEKDMVYAMPQFHTT